VKTQVDGNIVVVLVCAALVIVFGACDWFGPVDTGNRAGGQSDNGNPSYYDNETYDDGDADQAGAGEDGGGQSDAGQEDSDGNADQDEGTATADLHVPVKVIVPEGNSSRIPVTVGVPVPASTFSVDGFTVAGPSGPVPTQTRALVRVDPGGEITWLLVDFQAVPGSSYALESGQSPPPDYSVQISETSAGGLIVDTGAGQWEIPASSDLLGAVIGLDGEPLLVAASWGESVPAQVEIVDAGPLRAMVRIRARQAVQGLDLTARFHFYAGLPYARIRITLTNHNSCPYGSDAPSADNGECWVEPGQPACNGLLSPGRIELEDVTWTLVPVESAGPDELIYQDSSGTDRWNYYLGLGPRMQAGVSFRGFRHIRGGEVVTEGDVADGTLVAAGVRILVPWFRELFPKALRVRDGNLEIGLFPGEFAAPHRLRAGEQKTYDVWISLDPNVAPPGTVYAYPSFSWLRETHALGYIGPRVEGSFEAYEDYIDAQLDDTQHTRDDCNNDLDECATSLLDARRRWDYFGWTDFGDLPLDFENPRSPHNLKYDTNLGFIYQALRTGDVRWWQLAHAANVHFADIDILHSRKRGYSIDREWFEGGTWGHSYHNEPGLTNPHRNCGNPAPDTYWGGAGMSAWALISGDDVVREAAIELADNTLWRVLNSSDMECVVRAWGGGNGEGFAIFDPPLRAAANIQRILVWAWRLTGDDAYLDGAAGAARWYQCQSGRLTCASWPDAMLARSMGEYIAAARNASLPVDPAAESALLSILQSMANNLARSGDRAWLTGCTGDEINAWMFLAADAFAYGYAITGDRRWLDDYARPSFNTAARDPYYEGDTSQYHTAKEVANTVPNGVVFLHFAHGGQP